MKLSFAALMLAQFVACGLTFEQATRVKLEGGNPPTFVLSGKW